ncbi:MAG TPA: FAD-dependent oxidoreductase [Polyangiaceae bacterium]
MDNPRISRRDLLKGAAAGGFAGLAGSGVLCGCMPEAAVASSEASSEALVASASWLDDGQPEMVGSRITQTLEVEVLVVGAGNGGLFAACSSAEQGASTLVIEKNAAGETFRDGLGAIGTRRQAQTGTVIDKFELTKEIQQYAAGRCDQRLIQLWCDESAEAINWYDDRLAERGVTLWHQARAGNPSERYKCFATTHSPRWTGTNDGSGNELNGNKVLCDYAASLGVQFAYNTPMRRLIERHGRVCGVLAQDADGNTLRINARNGVILSTGGYSCNDKMLQALQPENLALLVMRCATPGATGDGIKACLKIGCKADEVHSSMVFDRGAVLPTEVAGFGHVVAGDGALFWIGSQPFLKVNLKGQRFYNESGTYEGVLHADAEQPGHLHCTVFDANFGDDIRRFATHGCSRMFPFDNGADPTIPWPVFVSGMLPELIARGYVVQSNSIEGLATALHIPPDTFRATVARYNQLFDNQNDVDFGKEAFRLSSLRTPPFFGVRNAGILLCTMDGIKIDTNMNALDRDDRPIPGLYVVGNDSGGFFAHTYPNLVPGLACGRTVTFGRRAGRIAATVRT